MQMIEMKANTSIAFSLGSFVFYRSRFFHIKDNIFIATQLFSSMNGTLEGEMLPSSLSLSLSHSDCLHSLPLPLLALHIDCANKHCLAALESFFGHATQRHSPHSQ